MVAAESKHKHSNGEMQTGVRATMKREQASPIGHVFINTEMTDRLIHVIASNHSLRRENKPPTNPDK